MAKKPRAFAERFQLAGGLCHEQAWIALSRAVQARSVEDGEARFVDMTSVWLASTTTARPSRETREAVWKKSLEITGEALVAINLRTPSAIRSALVKYAGRCC